MRSRVPMVRKPVDSCTRRLAAFSGKMLDWIVQNPASSHAVTKASSNETTQALAARVAVDVDGVLDHASVRGARRDR